MSLLYIVNSDPNDVQRTENNIYCKTCKTFHKATGAFIICKKANGIKMHPWLKTLLGKKSIQFNL